MTTTYPAVLLLARGGPRPRGGGRGVRSRTSGSRFHAATPDTVRSAFEATAARLDDLALVPRATAPSSTPTSSRPRH